jgi:thiamine-phosphate pyrophosphorylase
VAARRAPFDPPLCLITDRKRFPDPERGARFAPAEWSVLEAAIDAGIGALQLREKDLDGGVLLERARRLAERCDRSGVKLLVNDRVDVAIAAGAAGVHLPADGLPVAAARSLLDDAAKRGLIRREPGGALVGRSLHAEAEVAAAEGASFVVFGPVYDTPSKRPYGPPQGIERLRSVCRTAPVPVIAVGGITPERVGEIIAAGAAGVAVIGCVLDAADPAREVARLLEALRRAG